MKSVEKISLTFGIMVLLAIVMFFIGLYYNLSLAKTSLAILIPVVFIAIITFADLEKERYFSQREGGIILFICLLFPIMLFVSFLQYQGSFAKYVEVKSSNVDDIEYQTYFLTEPYLSIVKAMESYVDSKLSSDKEKNYMKENFFYTNKNIKRSDNGWTYYNETMTYPIHSFGGVICLNNINSNLCKFWLDRLVAETKDAVKVEANKNYEQKLKIEQEKEFDKKKLEEVNIFKKENKLEQKG